MIMDKCYFFKLIPENGPAQYTSEPIKWDSVNVILKRDPEWHGVNYEYSDGEIDLEFDCEAGKDIIEGVYQEEGVNGLILLQFGYTYKQDPENIEHIEYEGKLNLASRKIIKDRVACSVERSGLQDLIKSRWDTKVDLFSGTDLNNNAIPVPQIYNMVLHPKVLINNYNKKIAPEGSASYTPFGRRNWTDVYFTFDTTPGSSEDNNIQQFGGTAKGVMSTNPEDSDMFLFHLESDGEYRFEIQLDYTFNVALRATTLGGTPQINSWWINNYLTVNGTRYGIGSMTGYAGARVLGEKRITGAMDFTISLKRGDKVYIYSYFRFVRNSNQSKDTEAYMRNNGSEIKVTAKTFADYSSCDTLLVHEALSHAVKLATGLENPVYSDFFGREDIGYPEDGCGSKNAITNGFEIRNFDKAKDNYKSPQISLSSLLKSLNSLFCIGMAYENIEGQEKLRIEGRDYFYQNVEILELTDIGDYQEETAQDLIYNNIEIGYKKYLDEGIKLIDEFNTQHQYLSPIKRHDNPFSQLSDLIGSGYSLEVTRRYKFSFTEQDSAKYDDDCFIIAVRKASFTAPITFMRVIVGLFGYRNFIIFSSYTSIPIDVKVGDVISISGTGTSNDKNYTVISLSTPYVNSLMVTESVSAGTYIGTVVNMTSPYSTEKNEPFDLVSNLISPETSYNLRHTPKRMLLRWAKWLNGGFFYQQAGDIIKNTFFKQNGALITRLKESEPCGLGDINRENLQESGDIYLSEFHEKDNIFIPEYVTFTSRITKEQLHLIKDCMQGQDDEGRNYGYITLPLPDGNKLKAWLWELQYNPNTEKVTFKVLKKEVVYINEPPFICSDYADYTFGEFESMPGLSKKIELCRFQSFN